MPRNASSHSTFRDIFLLNISSPLNLTILCQTPYLIFYLNHVDDLVSKFNQSIGLIIPTLLVLLHLKYQSSNPFDTHPYTMGVAVLSLFAYYLARALHERCSSSLRRVSALSFHCVVWFGDISVASLMSMFLPGWIQPIIYIVYGLISAAQFLQKLFVEGTGSGWRSRIRHFLNNLGSRFCSSERAYNLPM